MRYRFAREGVTTTSGRYLEPNSLYWDEGALPVTWAFGYSINNILGKASDIRREEGGWISAEIEWKRETVWERIDGITTGWPEHNPDQVEMLLNSGEVELSIYCTHLVFHKTTTLHIAKAKVREISAVSYAGNWEEA